MTSLRTRLADDRRGTTSIEYGIIAALTGLALVAAAAALGDVLLMRYGLMEDMLANSEAHAGR